jgi:hypothetical protein
MTEKEGREMFEKIVLDKEGIVHGPGGQNFIERMLDDIEAVTKSRFYEDPDPIASPIEMFRMPEGKSGGEAFSELSPREKWQVLGDYTHWQDYEAHGIGFEELDRIFVNVIDGKLRERWLEGVDLQEKPELKQGMRM